MTRRKDTGIAALQTGTEGKKSKIGKSEDEVDGGKNKLGSISLLEENHRTK